VVLPNQTFYEKRGTTVNLEGRVLELHPAGINNGEADGAVAALALLADAVGVKPPVRLLRQAAKLLEEKYKLPKPFDLWRPKVGSLPPSFPPLSSGNLYLKPSMWRREQRVAEVARAVRLYLEAHPETARAEGLLEGATVELETPTGLLSALVRLDERLPKGFLFAPALGPWVGQRVAARVLVPAGGEM